jgi:hypothetical protein
MTHRIRQAWRRVSVSGPLIGLTRRRVAWQWRLRGRPLPPPHVVKQLALLRARKKGGFRTFIETGTFTGEMVAVMRPHVDRVISIEMSPPIHESAAKRFAGDDRVEILLGDSTILLPAVLNALNHPALFWLDGHFMGGDTGRGAEDSPIRAELDALLRHPAKGHVVLIDDARLFTGRDGYPTIAQLQERIERDRPGTSVAVKDDIIRCFFDTKDAVS